MTRSRFSTPAEVRLGYDPQRAAVRLAGEVAHVRASRMIARPQRLPLHVRARIGYRPVHWSELPKFLRLRALERELAGKEGSHG